MSKEPSVSGKMYRQFYDWNDNAIWASYDGTDVKILHIYTLDEIPDMGQLATIAACGNAIRASRHSERDMLEEILKNELGIIVTEQGYQFSDLKGYAEAHELPFSKEDISSADSRQYKIFKDCVGNWFAFASRATSNGRKRIINQRHLDEINRTYEDFLSEQGVDIRRLARYTEEGHLHVPTKDDFVQHFEICWDDESNLITIR